ncbi:MAG: DNA alkylation repair protein [Nitrospirae bacterium]|nr:MAG: DNA alkylation repair protein [Nitrospirota bacterium]
MIGSATAQEICRSLQKLGNEEIAAHSQGFFKTGRGEYAEGDKFLGIRVPVLRKEAQRYKNLSLKETVVLLKSRFHEARLLALFILIKKFLAGSDKQKSEIYGLYLKNMKHINNWDLVDCSAPYIVGMHLEEEKRGILYTLAGSNSLWERRTAIIATFHLIRENDFSDALAISEILLGDKEDLIHKAVGWMLREVGKRDVEILKSFLKKYYEEMPRTMLRYAIERFPEKERKAYLQGTLK